MIYDLIIIGAGAAGLFAGASLPRPVNGLILEKQSAPGRKLLMSGSGQCNLTHGGDIKDFISHYGKNGSRIRSVLYRFSNLAVMDFFQERGIRLFVREDEKVFPSTLKAQDVLHVLTEGCMKNGLQFVYSSTVDQITADAAARHFEPAADPAEYQPAAAPVYTVHCGNRSYNTKKLIIATGGCSYPASGSDGSIFAVLNGMGIAVAPLSPALVPVYVHQYPYQNLSGISFQDAAVTVNSVQNRDALLLTHTCFSGPAVLNLSRYAHAEDRITINFYPAKPEETIFRELAQISAGNSRQLLTVLNEYFNQETAQSAVGLPKRFLEAICVRVGVSTAEKASRISPAQLKSVVALIVRDEYKIRKLGGYEIAMVTAGGVDLSEINIKTMESKRYANLCFAGEVLNVDGDTGGYNLQFAFASGFLAARNAAGDTN